MRHTQRCEVSTFFPLSEILTCRGYGSIKTCCGCEPRCTLNGSPVELNCGRRRLIPNESVILENLRKYSDTTHNQLNRPPHFGFTNRPGAFPRAFPPSLPSRRLSLRWRRSAYDWRSGSPGMPWARQLTVLMPSAFCSIDFQWFLPFLLFFICLFFVCSHSLKLT